MTKLSGIGCIWYTYVQSISRFNFRWERSLLPYQIYDYAVYFIDNLSGLKVDGSGSTLFFKVMSLVSSLTIKFETTLALNLSLFTVFFSPPLARTLKTRRRVYFR